MGWIGALFKVAGTVVKSEIGQEVGKTIIKKINGAVATTQTTTGTTSSTTSTTTVSSSTTTAPTSIQENRSTIKTKKNPLQGLHNYVKDNLRSVEKITTDLKTETEMLIAQKYEFEHQKLSHGEKKKLKKINEEIEENLCYLYLIKDYFITLSKSICGMSLKKEELCLIIKFTPFFDGVPVFEVDYNYDDINFEGITSEILSNFELDEYIFRYENKIDNCIIPDFLNAIENYKNSFKKSEFTTAEVDKETKVEKQVIEPVSNEIECSICHTKIKQSVKFCPECGNKIEQKQAYCSNCGEKLLPNSKFCSCCGQKI